MTLYQGDCLTVLPTLEANSVHAIVTDPPYGLGFMGKEWDHGVPGEAFWREAIRVAKPGAHLLAFGGTRKFHRLMVGIEDAGWEIRDTIMWTYGSGFPKSLDVSKAIDTAAGAERELTRAGVRQTGGYGDDWDTNSSADRPRYDTPATPEAAEWDGWGTALKPAWEPIIVARKPLAGTVASNVLKHGTGGINVDACRVGTSKDGDPARFVGTKPWSGTTYAEDDWSMTAVREQPLDPNQGRWPANLIHDGSEEVLSLFPETVSGAIVAGSPNGSHAAFGKDLSRIAERDIPGDRGSAARFFYCAKASREDREEGLADMPLRSAGEATDRIDGTAGLQSPRAGASRTNGARNFHPTVKPTSLMRYLCKLVTPKDGVILDMFMGSGSTGKAAMLEGFRFIGIDLEADYVAIAERRIAWAAAQPRQEVLL